MFRMLRIPVAAWAIFWFGLFIPSHERGAVKLDNGGSASIGARVSSCCPPPAPDESNDPTGERARKASNCAVCLIVALLDAPAPLFTADQILSAATERVTSPRLVAHDSSPLTNARPRAPPAVA